MPALVKLLAAAAPAAEPDADLLARFVAARDDAAFAELVRRHGPAVYGTCRRLVGPAAADDAFQATFLVLAARAGSVRKAASVGSWLVGVAGRVARRVRRRDRRAASGRVSTDPDRLPGDHPPPDHRPLAAELVAALADEFTRLPDRPRAAAVACLVDGRTQEQAAEALGWSSRTVRRRLDEAKGLLRTRLERRGVMPALAAAAVAAAGEAAALPAGLARRAADAATLFLAGGGADARAAALARGVIGTMTTIRSTTAAAACAAVLAGLGIGWANDAPQPGPKVAPALKADSDRIPPPAAPNAPPAAAVHTHQTANFVVQASSEAVARSIGDEYERQRKAVATEWLGKELPDWREPASVRIRPGPTGGAYTGVVRFHLPPNVTLEGATEGTIEMLLGREAHRWTTRLVLLSANGGPFPWWASKGIDTLSDPDSDQRREVGNARQQLEDGRGYRLKTLFPLTSGPGGGEGVGQSASVVRFLLERTPDRRVAVYQGGSIGRLDQPPPLVPGQSAAKHGLFTFLLIGTGGNWVGTGGRWDSATKEVYGFASLDEMERAWVGWVRAQPGPPPRPADPLRIPAEGAPAAQPPAPKTRPAGAHTHKTANFVVEAPTAAVARALGDEFERQRKAAATEWLGKEIPAWKTPVAVRVEAHPSGDYLTGTIRFSAVPGAEVETGISGRLDALLNRDVRWWPTQYVLMTHLGGYLPRWAGDVVAHLDDPDAERQTALRTARRQLEDGNALRLAALFKMTTPPRGAPTADQSFAVACFLLTRAPDLRHAIVEGGSHALIDPPPPLAPGQSAAKRGLLTFIESGGRLTDLYGFASVAEMERAWIDWLRARPIVAADDAPVDPDRIPPAELTTPRGEPRTAGGATHRSANFAVTAPSAEVAAAVAEAAERHRRELARRWLGKELADAAERLPIAIKLTAGSAGGATTFTFHQADGKRPVGVKSAAMELHGPLTHLLAANVPHEVMHVVLATHFGRPVPRWADEGVAVLAESDAEQRNHDVRARELLGAGRAIRLSTLFRMTDYPRDMIVLYAQGYSVCRFLLARGAADPHPGGPPDVRAHKTVRYANGAHEVRFARGDREPALLAFLALGMEENSAESWATAAREVYGFDSTDALEQAWIDSLRGRPGTPAARPAVPPNRIPPGE